MLFTFSCCCHPVDPVASDVAVAGAVAVVGGGAGAVVGAGAGVGASVGVVVVLVLVLVVFVALVAHLVDLDAVGNSYCWKNAGLLLGAVGACSR